MGLTRKHYEAIASILHDRIQSYNDMGWELRNAKIHAILDVAEGLSSWFENDNPHFDRTRFMDAIRNGV